MHARGIEQQSKGVDNVLGAINLGLATGKFGKPGCGVTTITGQGNGQGGREHGHKCDQLPGNRDITNPEHRAHVASVWGCDVDEIPGKGIPALEIIEAIHAGEIKGLLSICFNPLVSSPDSNFTREALDKLGPFPLTAVLAHNCQARVLLKQGKLEEAEMEAREACRIQNFLPRYCLDAKATLIRALLEQGKAAGAISIAQDGLAAIQQGGSLGSAEVELRLAISEAFYAVKDHERAHRELRETLHQIELRADDIPDPFWRNSYLTRNPYCARAQQLARQWGLLS